MFALPLGSFIEAGAPGTKWTLLMTVVERQKGVGTQTLENDKNIKPLWYNLSHHDNRDVTTGRLV